MKCIILGFFVLLMACNVKESGKKNFNDDSLEKKDKYPAEIFRKGLEKCYNNAKWTMYCIYCDDTCDFAKNTGLNEKITFASLDLKLKEVEQFNDTTEIQLSFFYKDSIECTFPKIHNQNIVSGMGFKHNCDSIYYYTSNNASNRFWTNDPKNRYGKPLQPEVILYIKNNSEKLSPWFLNEARERGVL